MLTFFLNEIIILNMSSNVSATGKRIAMLGILSGLGLVAFMIESLVPIPYLPGAKIGLANVFSMLALVLYGLPDALIVVVVRTFLGSLFAGNFSMIIYSATAGVCSAIVSRLMLCLVPRISFVAVSVTSAVIHNLVQLSVYCGLTATVQLFGYAPYLCLLGTVSGAVVGLAVTYTLKAIPARILAHGSPKEEYK